MLTEQGNLRSKDIDQATTLEILQIMNDEDATVAEVVRQSLPDIAAAVDVIVQHLRHGGRLIYVGAGTSGRLGILDAAETVPTFSVEPTTIQALIAGGTTAVTSAVEGAEDNHTGGHDDLLSLEVGPQDVVVGIAASGRTPYVLGAMKAANNSGATTVGISCNMPSPLLEIAQIKISVPVGPEVIAGSTRLKAGTAQKMILNMLSTASMIRSGKVYRNLMVDVNVSNQKLAGRARRIVAEVSGVNEAEARRLLEQSGNEVKTAIVMSVLYTTPDEAREMLRNAGGMLRQIIENAL